MVKKGRFNVDYMSNSRKNVDINHAEKASARQKKRSEAVGIVVGQ